MGLSAELTFFPPLSIFFFFFLLLFVDYVSSIISVTARDAGGLVILFLFVFLRTLSSLYKLPVQT